MSRFSVPEPDELPADMRERIQAVSEKTGFVPNVFLALARRPDEFRAFFAYYDAVMLREGGLSKAEKEMIVVATSAANQCPYCVVAHGALLRLFSKNPLLGDQIAVNYRSADVDRRQRAMLDAALKLATARRASARTTSRPCWLAGSPRRTSGTSARSPACSPCQIGWRI